MLSKSRIFIESSREAAVAKAIEYFGCDEREIIFEVLSEGTDVADWQVYAFHGTQREYTDLDAGFGVYYEPDGVFLELYPERGLGESLNRTAMAQHLVRKSIKRYEEGVVQNLVINRVGRERIAPSQDEFFLGEDILIDIPQFEMEAHAKLLAPEPGGTMITYNDVMEKVAKAGITHGLDEQVLRNLINEKKYGEDYLIASATMPIDGENGKLVFHFSTDQKTAKPKELEGGKVDYRSLDLYEPVEEGQLLVERVLATEGTPGVSVKGKPIKQKPGKDTPLPKYKNVTINEGKTEMRAKTAGMVEYIYGSVNVSNVYKIDGDVDMSVGNIDFDGSIHIEGNVIAGHVIKASGGVIVGGVVEASEIYAGGNVEVKRGMQGMDKGRIEAGGSISLLYIERGTAVAGGSITVDASIHSVIEAGDSLYAKGKRGSIIGGRAIAAGEIVANSIGSVSQVITEIEVGVMPQKRARISAIEKELEKLAGEILKLDQLDTYLERAKEKLDTETFNKLYRSGVENRKTYTEDIGVLTDEIDALRDELEHANEGKVHVFDTVHPGTRVVISSDMYKVNDEMKYTTFKFLDGQITYMPCEKSKSG